jgi:mono/diheme cytochrome c family protein
MSDADFAATAAPLGPPKAGLDADLDALAAYVGSLSAAGRSPHRAADGSLTADALAGRAVFASSGCGTCHGGAAFSDSATGALHDVGTLGPASGPQASLDTPTLRGLWETGPYLHDGSRTLAEAVLAHAGVSLSAPELAQLVAYLVQIDDDEIAAPTNREPVFGPPPSTRLFEGLAASRTFFVSDPDGDALTVTASGLPPGLSWDAATLTASGTPPPGSAGSYTMTLQASDGVALVAAEFVWQVVIPQCSNGVDDDGDGQTDYPADPECAAPGDDRESPGAACGLGFEVAFVLGGLALRRRRLASTSA